MLNEHPSGHKADFEPESVPLPGPALAQAICRRVAEGHPAWRLGNVSPEALRERDLVVPQLTILCRAVAPGRYALNPARARQCNALRPRLALALETGNARAFDELKPHDLTQWRDLGVATLRDVLALSDDDIAEHCGMTDARKAREAYAKGRSLLSRLGAWPWCCLGPAGKPPRDWRSNGGSPLVNGAFATWASGRLHITADRRGSGRQR
ncbi:MAG: hypothetical protein ACRDLN_00940 [Solirubrobacteraceae bacterium]